MRNVAAKAVLWSSPANVSRLCGTQTAQLGALGWRRCCVPEEGMSRQQHSPTEFLQLRMRQGELPHVRLSVRVKQQQGLLENKWRLAAAMRRPRRGRGAAVGAALMRYRAAAWHQLPRMLGNVQSLLVGRQEALWTRREQAAMHCDQGVRVQAMLGHHWPHCNPGHAHAY